jgi:fused signal recognition particle receptor
MQCHGEIAFVPFCHHHRHHPSSSSLSMVFDFFKKRATEGLSQLSNLSDKARQGKLTEGLLDAAAYTSQTNKAFADGLAKSRNKFLYDLEAVFDSTDIYQSLEDVLIQSDIGLTTATEVVAELKSLREDSTQLISRDDLTSVLRGKLIEVLSHPPNQPLQPYSRNIRFETEKSVNSHIPTVLFVMGANGMGKTTTIGKLAHRLRTEGGQKVLLAACDTFRAGAVEQLMLWADRAGVECYGPPLPAATIPSSTAVKVTSPSAVLYGALDKAVSEKFDTLIVDTSGRLSNNEALTEELMKMKRVIQKRLSVEKSLDTTNGTSVSIPNTHVPHEILLVIDAAQGRMALESARIWNQQLELTGLVLTKLDGSARGGSVVAVSRELGLPVKLVGVGEQMEDLRDVGFVLYPDHSEYIYSHEDCIFC